MLKLYQIMMTRNALSNIDASRGMSDEIFSNADASIISRNYQAYNTGDAISRMSLKASFELRCRNGISLPIV